MAEAKKLVIFGDSIAKGVMFQIMRMMAWRVDHYLGMENRKWIQKSVGRFVGSGL